MSVTPRAVRVLLLVVGLALPAVAVGQDDPKPAPPAGTKAAEPPAKGAGDGAQGVKPAGPQAQDGPTAAATPPRRPLLVGAAAPDTLQLARVTEGASPDAKPELVPLTSLRSDEKSALVVLFWSPDCPVCKRYVNPYAALAKTFDSVAFVVVVAGRGRPPGEVAKILKEAALAVPVYADPDNAAATRLGVRVAPTALLFDPAGVLRYRGPLDDDRKAKSREPVPYLRSALAAIVAGKDVESSEPRPFGSALRR